MPDTPLLFARAYREGVIHLCVRSIAVLLGAAGLAIELTVQTLANRLQHRSVSFSLSLEYVRLEKNYAINHTNIDSSDFIFPEIEG